MFCLFIKETVMECTRHKTKKFCFYQRNRDSHTWEIVIHRPDLFEPKYPCFVFLFLKWFYFHNNFSYFVKSASSPENLVKFSNIVILTVVTFFFINKRFTHSFHLDWCFGIIPNTVMGCMIIFKDVYQIIYVASLLP